MTVAVGAIFGVILTIIVVVIIAAIVIGLLRMIPFDAQIKRWVEILIYVLVALVIIVQLLSLIGVGPGVVIVS